MSYPPAGGQSNGETRRKYCKDDRLSITRCPVSHAGPRFRLPRAPEPAQIEREVAGVLIPVLRIFRQGFVEDLVQLRRLLFERWRWIVDDRVHRLDRRVPTERPLPCKQFVEHQAQREDISSVIQRPCAGLFR